MSATIPEIAEAIVLRPGDKLLFRLPDDTDEEMVRRFVEVTAERWPDVPVLVVTGDVKFSLIRMPDGAEGKEAEIE